MAEAGPSKGPTPGGRLNRGGRFRTPGAASPAPPSEGLKLTSASGSRLPGCWWKRRRSKFRPLRALRSAASVPALRDPSRCPAPSPPPLSPAGLRLQLKLGARGSPATRLRSSLRLARSLPLGARGAHLIVASCRGPGAEEYSWGKECGSRRRPRGSCRRRAPGTPARRGARVRDTPGHQGSGNLGEGTSGNGQWRGEWTGLGSGLGRGAGTTSAQSATRGGGGIWGGGGCAKARAASLGSARAAGRDKNGESGRWGGRTASGEAAGRRAPRAPDGPAERCLLLGPEAPPTR